jgi:hypothetical protein
LSEFCFRFFFCLDAFFDRAQKKQKIKDNPIALPKFRDLSGLRAAKALDKLLEYFKILVFVRAPQSTSLSPGEGLG